MNKHFHVKGEERKRLVKVIAEVLGEEPKYLGVPSTAYQIGEYKVSRGTDGVGCLQSCRFSGRR